MSIRSAYAAICAREGLVHDPAQLEIVDQLQLLQDRIQARQRGVYAALTRLGFWRGRAYSGVRGAYLWGDVGRGKTFLMDLLFSSLTTKRRRRVHFHRLMNEVHDRLAALHGTGDPLDRVAGDIARSTTVLCFDEFFVSDIGDAMILARLLDGLFRRGVTLIATSNSAPADLYPDGLQRERFLPAIALLERFTQVLHLEGDADYRLRLLRHAGTYLMPAGTDADAKLEHFFHDSAPADSGRRTGVDVLGRSIPSRRRAQGIIWFDFAALCEGPRSQRDYIEIARRYQTVIVSDVPVLTGRHEDAARRFISMVDEFHDRGVKLIVSAAAPIDGLYEGARLVREFRRTRSRLKQMQSAEYLHAPHRA